MASNKNHFLGILWVKNLSGTEWGDGSLSGEDMSGLGLGIIWRLLGSQHLGWDDSKAGFCHGG